MRREEITIGEEVAMTGGARNGGNGTQRTGEPREVAVTVIACLIILLVFVFVALLT